MKKAIKTIILAICLIVFIYSAYKIFKYLAEEQANNKLNTELVEKAVLVKFDDTETEKDNEESTLPISIDFSVLKQENQDIIAWIYSENTPINYPIVQSYDNVYYLHRLINGNYNSSGTIFMDYRNKSDFTDNNTIIYGHNMKSDTMFGTLVKYKDQKYYDEHKDIYLFTPEKNYIIELMAGCTISVNSDIYNFSTLNQQERNQLIEKSDFKSDVTLTEEDRVIILSTCAYEYEGARYIVLGKLQ